MISFYKSPVGGSLIRKMREVGEKCSAVVMGRVKEAMQNLEKN